LAAVRLFGIRITGVYRSPSGRSPPTTQMEHSTDSVEKSVGQYRIRQIIVRTIR
jgi:hypothetical protein